MIILRSNLNPDLYPFTVTATCSSFSLANPAISPPRSSSRISSIITCGCPLLADPLTAASQELRYTGKSLWTNEFSVEPRCASWFLQPCMVGQWFPISLIVNLVFSVLHDRLYLFDWAMFSCLTGFTDQVVPVFPSAFVLLFISVVELSLFKSGLVQTGHPGEFWTRKLDSFTVHLRHKV